MTWLNLVTQSHVHLGVVRLVGLIVTQSHAHLWVVRLVGLIWYIAVNQRQVGEDKNHEEHVAQRSKIKSRILLVET